jgi:putative CocE/NonD family hydrolase
MQDGPKPEFLQNQVAYYVIGAEQWRYADSLEAITSHSRPLYLHSSNNPTDIFDSGSLEVTPGDDGGPDEFVYDPADVSLAALESSVDGASLVDQRMVHARAGRQLVYHTAPFEQPTEISGFFELSAWLAIDQPDTDVRAVIYDVAIDGTVVQLTRDWIRARYRQSERCAQLVDTDKPLHYLFQGFMFVSRRIPRGNRLRLVVGPMASMYWQKNYNSGAAVSKESMQDARPVTVKLFHDDAHPSALHVPYGRPWPADKQGNA